jgi:hypothetical protein
MSEHLLLLYHLMSNLKVMFEYLVVVRPLERLLLARREQGTVAQPEVHQQEVVL